MLQSLNNYNNIWNVRKELNDPHVLNDAGDVPVQEIRDCGVDDDKLMKVVSESERLYNLPTPCGQLIFLM